MTDMSGGPAVHRGILSGAGFICDDTRCWCQASVTAPPTSNDVTEMRAAYRALANDPPNGVTIMRALTALGNALDMIVRRYRLLDEARAYVQSFAAITKHPTAPEDAMNLAERIVAELSGDPRPAPETSALPESLRDPGVVMERVRTLHQQTDTALWLLRYLNRLGGLGHEKHALIEAVLEGRAYLRGDSMYTDGPTQKASTGYCSSDGSGDQSAGSSPHRDGADHL